MKKMPTEVTAEYLSRIVGKPWVPSGNFDESEEIKRGLMPKEETIPESFENAPRAIKFTDSILEEFGFTENCPFCLAKVNGTKFTGPHTEECRTRIEDLMMNSGKEIWKTNWRHRGRRGIGILKVSWIGQSKL